MHGSSLFPAECPQLTQGNAATSRPTASMLEQALGTLAAIILLPLIMLLGILVVIDSPGPMLVRVPHVRSNGRVGYRLELRTLRSFDPDADAPGPAHPRETHFYRLLRCTRLSRLPAVFDVMNGKSALSSYS